MQLKMKHRFRLEALWRITTVKKDKKIVEYCQDERMLFRLGKVNYTKAHRPLTVHTHEDMTEGIVPEGIRKIKHLCII